MRYKGVVVRFDQAKGYGYIAVKGMPDVICLRTAVQGDDRTVREGQWVEFSITAPPHARQALDVVKIDRPIPL